jgi:general control protein GCN4
LQQHQQQQFYASSAPSSSTALQQHQHNHSRPARPQVPLFSQSTGNIPQTPTMALQGMHRSFLASVHSPAHARDSQARADMDLFDDFTAFEGGASTQNTFSSAFSSPAVPTIYDTKVNISSSSSTNMGTVSPQDLLVRDPFASAPNSTAFTNLTSPSTYNESPDYKDAFDVSPFVGNGDLDQSLSGDPWYPLFPQDEQLEMPAVDNNSPLLPEEELEVSEALRTSRRRSGTTSSPPSGSRSSLSGVSARKRDKPLPPIIVEDPNDTVAMKRARNTLAARKSRQRKMQRFEELEDKITKLEAERDHWKEIALRRQ